MFGELTPRLKGGVNTFLTQIANGVALFKAYAGVSVKLSAGDSPAPNTAAGSMTVAAGDGFGTASAGSMTVQAGSNVTSSSATYLAFGGTLNLLGGDAYPFNNTGGTVNIKSGRGGQQGNGGDINIMARTSYFNVGGTVTISGESGGAGAVKLLGGDATGGTCGAATVQGGNGSFSAVGGPVSIAGGDGGSTGGVATFRGGDGTGNGAGGGNATLRGGSSFRSVVAGSPAPGIAYVLGGAALGGSNSAVGGAAVVKGGAGGASNAAGGNVTLSGGDGGGTGPRGNVVVGDTGAALATSAAGGFFCLSACSGVPTGTPANVPTGAVALVIDSTTGKLYDYVGGVWVNIGAATLANWTEAVNTATPNATVPVVSLTATNAATNVDAVLKPKGAGAVAAHIADNTTTGGNKRGASATDWQTVRNNANQVASGYCATIGGGYQNRAAGDYSFAVGNSNAATGTSSTAWGNTSTASAIGATAGGYGSSASNTGAFAVGESANASGAWAAALGKSTVASGNYSFAVGGATTADAAYSVASGNWSWTRGIIGARAHAGNVFINAGDTQEISVILCGATTDATPKTLTVDNGAAGTANQLTLQSSSSLTVTGRVVARCNTTSDTASWTFVASIKRNSSNVAAMVASCTPTLVAADSGASAWTLAVSADTTNNALQVVFTGAASTNIRVTCVMNAAEIKY